MSTSEDRYTNMVTRYRSERTINGFGIDVMKSALQKYIRRGKCKKALYCAGEMDLFKHVEGGEKIRANFLHRLMIIFMEDVGLGAIELWPTIDRLVFSLIDVRKRALASRNTTTEADMVSEIVTLMCKSEKARNCSHLRAISKMDKDSDLISEKYYPDIQKMRQTFMSETSSVTSESECREKLEAALVSRDWLAVWWAGQIAQIKSASVGKQIIDIVGGVINTKFVFLKPLVAIAARWYQELKTVKESFLCWLLLIDAVIQVDSFRPVNIPKIPKVNGWALNLSGHTISLDDYVFDIHTKAKQQQKRKGAAEFAEIGAFVWPQSGYVVPRFKDFYEDIKRYISGGIQLVQEAHCVRIAESITLDSASSVMDVGDSEDVDLEPDSIVLHTEDDDILIEDDATVNDDEHKRETQEYEFLVRAQVNTSASKPDVYFATEITTGRFVVVKGPYSSQEIPANIVDIAEWKKQNGLPFILPKVKLMYPDLWPPQPQKQGLRVPLGIRNKFAVDKLAYFIIFPSFVKKEDIRFMRHGTKLWPDYTMIVDWNNTDANFHLDGKRVDKLSQTQMRDYVSALLFRWMFGISDIANRNFLVIGDHVISVDEEYCNHFDAVSRELSGKKMPKQMTTIVNWIQQFYSLLGVDKWKVPADTQIQKRYQVLTTKDGCLSIF